jgi:hypothetical protein
MNERIKELAKQADNYAYKMNPEQDSYGRSANPRKFQQDRDAKFAELIIRECARVIDRGDGAMSSMAETSWCNICRDDILKHFGVEE